MSYQTKFQLIISKLSNSANKHILADIAFADCTSMAEVVALYHHKLAQVDNKNWTTPPPPSSNPLDLMRSFRNMGWTSTIF